MIGPGVDPFTGLPPRELAAYQDQPRQLPTGSPGKNGYLRMGFEVRDGRTVLADLERRAPTIVQQALYWDEAMPDLPCVFMISNAGGILQGDRNVLAIAMEPGARAHVTTQSAMKIQSMDANYAGQWQEIALAKDSYLEFLPDPLIPHRNTRFITKTRIVIHPTATLLYAEILMAGRKHYRDGELFAYDVFSSTVRAERPDGEELFTEKFVIEPAKRDVRPAGVMGEFDVFGNVLLLTPPAHVERIIEQLPAEVNHGEQWAASASRLPNEVGIVFKVLGMETQPVRDVIRRFWGLVRREVTGHDIPREFAWR